MSTEAPPLPRSAPAPPGAIGFRPLRPGETDHECLWLLVTLGTATVGFLWLRSGLPFPVCPLKTLTGCPCPTCGATRATLQLLRGHLGAAFAFNPLIALAFGVFCVWCLYAATVLAFRLPRLRIDSLSPPARHTLRFSALSLLLLNWAWLILDGR